jgi:Tol biopolymer transport system component
MLGQTIAHYTILEKLGEGGMGVVYKARDTHLDRFVAIKVLPPEKLADPERKRRFVQEAKAASALNHPNIITIHDITGEAGFDFIVMEFIPGKTLDARLWRMSPTAPATPVSGPGTWPMGPKTPWYSPHWRDYRGIISPDGSRVAFTRLLESGSADLYVIPAGGGAEEKLVGGVAGVMGWSSDSRKILYMWDRPFRFRTIDVNSHAVVDFLQHPKHNVDNARFSPDDRWVCFKVEQQPGHEVTFIAPVRSGVAAQESEWIQITNGPVDGRSWWSPNGNLLYFQSDRDGSLCIWAQKLDAAKRPLGPASAVYHFHGGRRSATAPPFGYGMAPDNLYFAMQETIGNIWLAEPQGAR